MKMNLSSLPAPGPLYITPDTPLTLGTYSQRTCVRYTKGEFLRPKFASLVSVVALGFAALSHKHVFLTLNLSDPYFKVQRVYHPFSTICINIDLSLL